MRVWSGGTVGLAMMDTRRPPTILIVDDEPDIRQLIARACQREGLQVHEAATAEEGLRSMSAVKPDLVVLDLSLPDDNGLDVCREIRRKDMSVPIIIVTAKGEETDKVIGLELGADDYVTKPFGVRELVARIRAHLRKAQSRNPDPPASPVVSLSRESVRIGRVRIWFDEREVKLDDEPVTLTRTEFDILWCLAENMGRVLSRDQIVSNVWGFAVEGSERLVDAHIRNLRKKLERDPRNPEMIVTVRQVGYRVLNGE